MTKLKQEIRKVCGEQFLVCGEGDEQGSQWMDKVRSFMTLDSFIDEFQILRYALPLNSLNWHGNLIGFKNNRIIIEKLPYIQEKLMGVACLHCN